MENSMQMLALVLSCFLNIVAAITCITTIIKKVKQPNEIQNDRLNKVEEKLERYDSLFKQDNKRLTHIEDGNRVTQRALLALLAHGIDGNDIEAMKKAKAELTEYLIQG